jgi:beta-glucosidase
MLRENTIRIDRLMAQMTLREKLGQCVMIEPCFCLWERTSEQFDEHFTGVLDPAYLHKLLNEYCIGAFLIGGASRIGDGSARAWADYLAQVNAFAATTRLAIPVLFGIDAVHGLNFLKGSTIYSHNLGVAATWDPPLAKDYAGLVARELAGIGFNCNFAPTIDVARDPRWGRVYESLGEDPHLAAEFSRAMVEGMQSGGDIAACAKHFIGYGESRNGMDRTAADLSDRCLLETHAPPFEAAIASGVLTVMASGADVNGVPMPASKRMLGDLLRRRLGFDGVTLSDWEDVERLYSRHKIVLSTKEAVARAFNAGIDLNMAVAKIEVVDDLAALVEAGHVSIERVDEAARRVLRAKSALGLFDRQPIDVDNAGELVGSADSRAVAKSVALESMTLLKNEGGLLPLPKQGLSVLVTGRCATSKRHLCAGWTLGWASAQEEDLDCQTLLGAIEGMVGADATVTFVDDVHGLEQLQADPSRFDVCISVVSEEPHAEWTGDSFDLKLEDDEAELLSRAIDTGIAVVMVALLGRPLNITAFADRLTGILWAWSPGTEGAAAVAEVLFGDFNPCGRLPLSFPKDANQVPVVYNARRYLSDEISTRYDPLFPFGHGLSFTHFVYSNLVVPESVTPGEPVQVTVDVCNAGERDGVEVVQLYLTDVYASVSRPLKSLKAFTRVVLDAGEQKTVSLTLTPAQLSLYDEDLRFVQEPRMIDVQIADQRRRLAVVDTTGTA